MDLKETISLWDRLKQTDKPVVLYGMGNGADKILDELARRGLGAAGVFASDEFCRGQQFRGLPVMNYENARREFSQMVVLVAFGTQRADVISRVKMIAGEQELYIPDVPVVGGAVFDDSFLAEHRKELEAVYESLEDELSRRTFRNMLDYKISGKPAYLFDCECSIDSVYQEILQLTNEESYVDVGAYTGDTVREFLGHVKAYRHIYAVEPDEKNFRKLQKNTETLENISLFHLAAYQTTGEIAFGQRAGRNSAVCEAGEMTKADSLDHLLGTQNVSYIKFDVEGQELKALNGTRQIIKEQKPRLLVSAYHRNEDLYAIPLLIAQLRKDYKVYLRHYPCLPAWDTNFYFV